MRISDWRSDVCSSDLPTPEKGFYYRSDHFSFAKLGVPMFNFGSGEDLVEGGKEAGKKASEDYEEHRYHAPGDEYEAIANWDGMLADLQLYYAAGRMLAMTDAWPNWEIGRAPFRGRVCQYV